MLQQSSDLAVSYYLKELFYEFIASPNRHEAARKLKKFIIPAQFSEPTEFNNVLTMLYNWTPYIMNSFDCPCSNVIRKVQITR